MRRPAGSGRCRGLVALVTVVIIGALVLSIGLAATFANQTGIILSGEADREHTVRALASACLEEAMLRLKRDGSYVGGTIPISGSSCSVTVSGAGSSRTIDTTATYGDFTKSLQAIAALQSNGAANARSWRMESWSEVDP
ncbi:hypothetical protein AMJ57_03930 [Parcubacteria bacterium SG8_24]|nr:MAG: hypothetical protein AMJ57_03930 [Parcubacteria bacterium SG8_24]